MYTNFGGHGLSSFGDIFNHQAQIKSILPFRLWGSMGIKKYNQIKLYGIHTAYAQKQRGGVNKMEDSNHVNEDPCNQPSKNKTIPSFLGRKGRVFMRTKMMVLYRKRRCRAGRFVRQKARSALYHIISMIIDSIIVSML